MNYLAENKTINTNKVLNNQNTELQEEVFNFLESLKPQQIQKEKNKQINKNKINELSPEEKEKNKNFSETKGLTDNILNDYEYKDKARKGLLLLLNKLSGGTFCPDIKDYFKDLKESRKNDINFQNSKKENKSKTNELNNKNLRRQNFLEKSNALNKDRVENKTITDEEAFKLNFINAVSKDRGALTTINNPNTKPLNFKKRDNKKKKGNKEKSNEDMKFTKNYLNDLSEKELHLFYSDRDLEKSDQEGKKKKFKSKYNAKNTKSNINKKNDNHTKLKKTGSLIDSEKKSLIVNQDRRRGSQLISNASNFNNKLNAVNKNTHHTFKSSKTKISNSNLGSNKFYKTPQKSNQMDHASSES